jgi:hypothetical protein
MIWKEVEANDNYEVSDQGDVRNKNTKRILKQVKTGKHKSCKGWTNGRRI